MYMYIFIVTHSKTVYCVDNRYELLLSYFINDHLLVASKYACADPINGYPVGPFSWLASL